MQVFFEHTKLKWWNLYTYTAPLIRLFQRNRWNHTGFTDEYIKWDAVSSCVRKRNAFWSIGNEIIVCEIKGLTQEQSDALYEFAEHHAKAKTKYAGWATFLHKAVHELTFGRVWIGSNKPKGRNCSMFVAEGLNRVLGWYPDDWFKKDPEDLVTDSRLTVVKRFVVNA